MKVLLLTTHMNRGGIGIYTLNLAKYLRKTGVDATVASSGGDLEEELEAQGVPHVRLNLKTKAEWSLRMWSSLPRVARLIKTEGFHIVHAQTRVAQVLACLAGKLTGVPFVSTCHGFFKHRRLSRRIFPCWGERVIAISDSVRGHLRDDFGVEGSRIVRIYNGIELGRYISSTGDKDRGLMKEIGLSSDAVIVGSIGRLSSVKGYKYLMQAFSDLARKQALVQLLIVGEGPEKEALQKQITELKIEDKVILTPGGRPLEEYLAIIDVFCLPSVNEGLGLALMEAMAAGRACVASDVGGISELIKSEEDGLLVPSENVEALGAAISRLVSDDRARKRLGERARGKAADNFSIEVSVDLTAELYREIVGKV